MGKASQLDNEDMPYKKVVVQFQWGDHLPGPSIHQESGIRTGHAGRAHGEPPATPPSLFAARSAAGESGWTAMICR